MNGGRGGSLPYGGFHASPPVLLALAYVIWRPVSNGNILYPCLALIGLAGLADIVLSRRSWDRQMVAGCWLFLSLTLGWLLYGALRGNPGVEHQAATWLIGPIAWSLWAFSIRIDTIKRIITTVVLAGIFLSGVIVLYTAQEVGWSPVSVPDGLLAGQNAGIDLTSGTALRFYGLSSLVMTAPLAATGAILGRDELLPKRSLLILGAILGTVAAFLGGRRAVAVVALAIPLVVFAARSALGTERGRRTSTGVSVLGIGAVALFTSLDQTHQLRSAIADTFTTFSGLSGGEQDVIRTTQVAQLFEGFAQSPWVGSGLGAILRSGYIRSEERPWQFELQYNMDLFALGAVGTLLLVVSATILAFFVMRAWRAAPRLRPTLTSVTAAAVSVLIVNGSNPYLQAVGHQWAVPLALGVAAAVIRAPQVAETSHGSMAEQTQVARAIVR